MKPFLVTLLFFLPILFTIQDTSCENILAVAFQGSKSHKNVYEPLYLELAKRGHKLTVIHPIKSNYADPNIKEINGINFDSVSKEAGGGVNFFDLRMANIKPRTPINPMIIPIMESVCSSYYEMPEIKAVLKQKFALVFLSSHMNECAYGFVSKLNTSYIFLHTMPLEHYKSSFIGFRHLPSFTPSYAIGAASDDMGFIDRTYNLAMYLGISALYDWYYLPKIEAIYRKYLGNDVPSVREIERNASLIFHNAHFSLTLSRPQMPQVIDVGGMHVKPGNPLPKDLQDFVDSSGSAGFILFSFGSHVKPSDMPESTKQAFVRAFGKLKQKVIWKWDQDKIEGLSSNIKLVKWAPQQDLLASPKIRAFISHGGLLSTQEAAYHGVPIIGFPLFGDQDWNMGIAEQHGYGIALELKYLNEEQIFSAVNKVVKDKRYTEAAKSVGKLFKDRQVEALQSAVYWSEYVIRHKGATHLRSPAAKLNFFAYYSLDSIAFLGLILFLSFYIPIMLCKILFCGKKNGDKKREKSSKKKNN